MGEHEWTFRVRTRLTFLSYIRCTSALHRQPLHSKYGQDLGRRAHRARKAKQELEVLKSPSMHHSFVRSLGVASRLHHHRRRYAAMASQHRHGFRIQMSPGRPFVSIKKYKRFERYRELLGVR